MNLLLKIKSEYQAMSKANRKVADFLTASPAEFLSLSAIEIGEQSETSSATVIRFTRQLGFRSLEELKINIAQQQHEMQDSDGLDTVIQLDDSMEQMARKVSQLVTDTVQMTLHRLDFDELQRVLDCIRNADNVFLFGMGTSGASANDLCLKLNRANVRSIYTTDPHAAIEFAVHMRPQDVAVVFSYSGRTREVVMAAEQAKRNGATVIAITRSQPSPLHRLADLLLEVPDNEQLVRIGAIASKYSAMVIVELIFLGIVQGSMAGVQQGIVQTASLIHDLKEKENKNVKG